MLGYLLSSATTYRERILTSRKSKTMVNTFFLPSLSFVGFHGGFGILPLLLLYWIVAFWSFFGGIMARMEYYQWWGGMTYKLIRFVALCWVCYFFQWCLRLSDDPWIFFRPCWYHHSGCFPQQGLGMSPYPPQTGRSWHLKAHIFLITSFLNELALICWHIFKWLQELRSNANNSI